jgi:predicted nuclease with TOPRIM domain
MANTNYPSATPQRETPRNNSNKNILIGILAAGLLGTWGYLLYDKNQNTEKLETSQVQVNSSMSQRDSVQLLYNDALSRLDSLTGSNNNIQGQLGERQSEISKLKNEIRSILNKKNATAAELSRAKSLINEMNGKIANLEAEVTRLTGENQVLASTNTQLSTEKEVLTTNLQTASTDNQALTETVDVASTFSASNMSITPINVKNNGKEKTTTTAKRVDKLVIGFDVENRIAKSGPADMYVVVTAPNGQVISDPSLGSGTLTTRSDGDVTFTSKVTTEYETGTRKRIEVPLQMNDFQTGDYKIAVYQNGFKIGEGVKTLKKGGLFG